jgi:hypothetical protein
VEIPGSQFWQLHKEAWTQCYVCDKKVFGVFFWAPEIGMLQGYDSGLSTAEQF